jgi:hypothetical protein
MTEQLPSSSQTHLDTILSKISGLLKGSREHTSARSEFMEINGSVGGQVLSSNPAIEHPYKELSDLYMALFAQAKKDGVDLREIETVFERKTTKSAWTHRTRFITQQAFAAFEQKALPIGEQIGALLRQIGAETSPEWYRAVFDRVPEAPRTLVLHGDRVRVVKEPTPALLQHAAQLTELARGDGFDLKGGSWSVSRDEEEEEADGNLEVDGAVAIQRSWSPTT